MARMKHLGPQWGKYQLRSNNESLWKNEKDLDSESEDLRGHPTLPLAAPPALSRLPTYAPWLVCWPSAFLGWGQQRPSKGQPRLPTQGSSLFIHHPAPFIHPSNTYHCLVCAWNCAEWLVRNKRQRVRKKDRYKNMRGSVCDKCCNGNKQKVQCEPREREIGSG